METLSIPIILTTSHSNHPKKIIANLKLKGAWNELRGKLKQEYGKLTDENLIYVEGKEEEMLGRLQKKTGKAGDELKNNFSKINRVGS